MEPNYSSDTNAPTSIPGEPTPKPPKKRWPFSRKVTIIIGVTLAVVVLAVLAAMLGGSEKKTESDKTGRASLYVQRPGYENEGEGIGDATALISKATNKVVQYGGVNVVQACTVLTIKDIRDAGLKIEANQLTGAVQRTFMDGEGPGILPKASDSFLPFDNESNHCQYNLTDKGLVDLIVYQPAYVNQKAIAYELDRRYAPGPDVEGFQTYNYTHVDKDQPNDTTVFLRSPDISAALRTDMPDKAIRDKIIKLTAQRLRQGLSTPTPIQEFTYESPIFTGKVVNGCKLVNNAEFKAVLGVDSGPYVDEMMSSAVGVIENYETKELYNYVSHHCKRRSADGSTKDKTLTVNIETYETVEGAKANTKFELNSGFAKNVQAITPTIGDESYYADTAGLDKAVVLRKGRIIVRVNYYLPRGNAEVTAAQRIQALTPLVTSIANEKLKGF